MREHLRALAAALTRAGCPARVETSPGGSRAVLSVKNTTGEVICRSDPADGRWWFWWRHGRPIATADKLPETVEEIRRTRNGHR